MKKKKLGDNFLWNTTFTSKNQTEKEEEKNTGIISNNDTLVVDKHMIVSNSGCIVSIRGLNILITIIKSLRKIFF